MARIFLLDNKKAEAWLEEHVPSRTEAPAYLQAYAPRFAGGMVAPRLKYVYAVKERLGQRLLQGPDPEIEAVARQAGLLTGKWIMYVPLASVDALWRQLVLLAVREEALGPVAVKVASAGLARTHPEHPDVFSLCVYVADGFDEQRAMEVAALLKKHVDLSVLAEPLRFKLDVHTELNCKHGSFLYQA